jgi:hypothetical protein
MGRQYKGNHVMEILSWFLVEAFAATALLLLVVWWTWPRKPRNADEDGNNDADSRQDRRS